MIYIKRFENLKGESPVVGDYVILDVKPTESTDFIFVNFIDTHIGKVIDINYRASLPYTVEFDDIVPYQRSQRSQNNMGFDRNEIVYFSSSKEELEIKMNIKKYNL